MTDKDKELEENIKFLSKCCHNEYNDIRIDAVLLGSLDLITRQQAKIERLNEYNENLKAANTALSNEILDIKSEAVKEFAEKLKENSEIVHLFSVHTGDHYMVDIDDIDNLVKEMVGE